jgi:hypothetical protein
MSSDIESKFQSTLLRLSAHDRTPRADETNSSFSIDIRSQNIELKSVVAIQVVNVQIPNVFYNIPEGQNTFDFDYGGAQTITIIPGQYDFETLMDEFLSQMDTITGQVAGTSTKDFDDVTQKMSFTTAVTISFDSSEDNPIAYKLGFGDASYSGTSFDAPYIINIIGPHTVSVHSSELSNNVLDYGARSGTVRMIAEVPLDKPFGFMCYYRAQSSSDLIKYKSLQSFNRISLVLRDIQGRRLDISNHDWSLTARIYHL